MSDRIAVFLSVVMACLLMAAISDVGGGGGDVADDTARNFGTDNDAQVQWSTVETNDTWKFGVDATNNRMLIVQDDDIGSNTSLGNETHPTLTIGSNANNRFAEIYHDGSYATFESQSQAVRIKAQNSSIDMNSEAMTGVAQITINNNSVLRFGSSGQIGEDATDQIRITDTSLVGGACFSVAVADQFTIHAVDCTSDGHFVVSGGFKPGFVTADPCAGTGFGAGTIFYNSTSNRMCFCDGTNDLNLADGSACF